MLEFLLQLFIVTLILFRVDVTSGVHLLDFNKTILYAFVGFTNMSSDYTVGATYRNSVLQLYFRTMNCSATQIIFDIKFSC
jgi:hypothetical protein